MCVDKLICKDKLICSNTNTSGSIVFSCVGHASAPIQYLAVLLKAPGSYTLTLKNATGQSISYVSNQGTGDFEFCVMKGFSLTSPNIYILDFSDVMIHEINMATMCLCNPDEC